VARPATAATKPVTSKLSSTPNTYKPAPPEERKRTQRVMIRVRANIHVAKQGKATTLEALTVSVNPQGALVMLKESLPPDTRLVLEHMHTKETVPCRVPRLGKEMPDGFHIPLEFDSPAPDFWKIAFPPSDWRPEEM
jgi:hypothetical protein